MKSKIGIVICGLTDNRQYVTDSYVQAIKSCGAIPLILPLVKSKRIIEAYTSLCDGFLFCGGGDLRGVYSADRFHKPRGLLR